MTVLPSTCGFGVGAPQPSVGWPKLAVGWLVLLFVLATQSDPLVAQARSCSERNLDTWPTPFWSELSDVTPAELNIVREISRLREVHSWSDSLAISVGLEMGNRLEDRVTLAAIAANLLIERERVAANAAPSTLLPRLTVPWIVLEKLPNAVELIGRTYASVATLIRVSRQGLIEPWVILSIDQLTPHVASNLIPPTEDTKELLCSVSEGSLVTTRWYSDDLVNTRMFAVVETVAFMEVRSGAWTPWDTEDVLNAWRSHGPTDSESALRQWLDRARTEAVNYWTSEQDE